jgi:tetratricopeptide (TPR) repeat protein
VSSKKKKLETEAKSPVKPDAPAGTPPAPDVVPEPIAAVGARVAEVLAPHKWKLLAVLGGVLLILVGMSVWGAMKRSGETKATRAFAEVTRQATGEVLSDETPPPSPEDDLEDDRPKFKTAEERAQATLKAIEAMQADHGGASATTHTMLLKASELYSLGKYDEALAAYRDFLKGDPVDGTALVGREGVGYSLEAQGKLDEALAAFKEVQPDEKKPGHDLSLYHQGRILALQGKKAEAKELFQKALTKNPSLLLKQELDRRVALLDAPTAATPPKTSPGSAPATTPATAPASTPASAPATTPATTPAPPK